MLSKHLDEATAKHAKVKGKIERILADPSNHDTVYKVLNRVFNHSSAFNLKRTDEIRYEIRDLARKRFELGYPPRKQNDTSIGDAVNWEWIVRCAQKSNENHHVLIVSRDGDYGARFGDEVILNDWLRKEFKERVSRKRQIELTARLTTALKRLDEQVSEEETEEDKIVSEVPSELYRKHLVDILLGREPDKALGKELFERFFPEVTPVQD